MQACSTRPAHGAEIPQQAARARVNLRACKNTRFFSSGTWPGGRCRRPKRISQLVLSRLAPPTGGGGFKRSAHSAGPRSFSKQCCLKVASVKLLARWRSHRFFFSRVGTFGCRFRCLLGAFGDPRAALGVAWGSFGGPLGAFFGVFGTPLGSPGSPREPLSVPGELFGRSWAAVWPSGSLWGRPPGKSGKF